MKVAYLPAQSNVVGSGSAYNWHSILKYLPSVSLEEADIVHVNSDTYVPDGVKIDVYTCQGGVCPMTSDTGRNIARAKFIVTGSHWIAYAIAPQALDGRYAVIPNGIDLEDWLISPGKSEFAPGFVLVKGYLPEPWLLDVVYFGAAARPDLHFVCLGWSSGLEPLANMTVLQTPISHETTRALLNDCALYVSPLLETGFIMCLEAWMCDKPVLAVKMGAHLELPACAVHADRPGGTLYTDTSTFLDGLDSLLGTRVDMRGEVERNYSWPGLASYYNWVYECASKI